MQRVFEKRQLALTEKYKYVAILQQKIDAALTSFAKVLQTTGDDMEQLRWLNQFAKGYSDVFYYQQNEALFAPLKNYMDELLKTHKCIEQGIDDRESYEGRRQLEEQFRKIYTILQSILK